MNWRIEWAQLKWHQWRIHITCGYKSNNFLKLKKKKKKKKKKKNYDDERFQRFEALMCLTFAFNINHYEWLQLGSNPQLLGLVWLNGWVLVCQLDGCGLKSRCSHLNVRYCACFKQGVPWHSGNFRMQNRFKTSMWHGKNAQMKEYACLAL